MTRKILVIEDNDDVRENIEEILLLSNYEVITAGNGKAGVEAAVAHIPDLVVCDIMMPVLDGYGVLHLLNKNPLTASIPFIFLTAKSEKADWRKGMELGADDYITKPFDGIELLNAVEMRLKKADAFKQNTGTTAEQLEQLIKKAGSEEAISLTSDEREVYTYSKKHSLYMEGQRPKAVYYLQEGKVKVFRTNKEGKELITNVFSKGDFFGFYPILQETNYKESAEILEDAQVMNIPREDFIQLITANTQVARQFIRIMSNDVIEKEEDLLNMAYNSLRKKVAHGITKLLDTYGEDQKGEKILKLSRENLAQATGVATESLIRTLADFKSEGLIEIRTGKIVILNEEKLRNLPY